MTTQHSRNLQLHCTNCRTELPDSFGPSIRQPSTTCSCCVNSISSMCPSVIIPAPQAATKTTRWNNQTSCLPYAIYRYAAPQQATRHLICRKPKHCAMTHSAASRLPMEVFFQSNVLAASLQDLASTCAYICTRTNDTLFARTYARGTHQSFLTQTTSGLLPPHMTSIQSMHNTAWFPSAKTHIFLLHKRQNDMVKAYFPFLSPRLRGNLQAERQPRHPIFQAFFLSAFPPPS